MKYRVRSNPGDPDGDDWVVEYKPGWIFWRFLAYRKDKDMAILLMTQHVERARERKKKQIVIAEEKV